MVGITVYIVIMNPVVQGAFTSKHCRGHGVLYMAPHFLRSSFQAIGVSISGARSKWFRSAAIVSSLIRRNPAKLVFKRQGPIGQPSQIW
jgi:hypothetical protein